jgi:uncharacterized membrane protein YfhO
LAADGVFRAVRASKGLHVISFRYAPASFWLGAALSGCTALGLFAIRLSRRRLVGRRGR